VDYNGLASMPEHIEMRKKANFLFFYLTRKMTTTTEPERGRKIAHKNKYHTKYKIHNMIFILTRLDCSCLFFIVRRLILFYDLLLWLFGPRPNTHPPKCGDSSFLLHDHDTELLSIRGSYVCVFLSFNASLLLLTHSVLISKINKRLCWKAKHNAMWMMAGKTHGLGLERAIGVGVGIEGRYVFR
jgi:hypothetical protein